jgi:two-component system, NtrC family, sensor histidine kinase PilS
MQRSSRDPNAPWFGRFDPSIHGDGRDPADSPWQSTQTDATGSDERRAAHLPYLRTYRTFLSARALLAVVLLGLLAGNWLMGNRGLIWIVTAVCYASMALLMWAWPSTVPHQRELSPGATPSLSPRQALFSVGLDLAFFSVLQHLTSTALNTQALLALPVLMAGVLMPRVVALAVAAVASLNLLAAAWIQGAATAALTAHLTEAGLTGFGLFAIAALASELAARVAREERSARGSLELARQQAQLNRLVMEEMSEGVLVLDRQGRVRSANPSARRLLSSQGLAPAAPFQLRGIPAWQGLVQAVEQAVSTPLQAESGQEVLLRFDDGNRRQLRVRVRFTRGNKALHAEDMCMLWLEDLRIVRARQRQDKLAAMGRMSAGIAHEIRNPLAAISQANALLGEDATTPTQHRLTRMIAENVVRLQHIVDDILAVAPGARPPAPAINLVEAVASICNEWRLTHGLSEGSDSLLQLHYPPTDQVHGPLLVRFEPEHLQRVLVNLLDNALRHGSGQPGAIDVTLTWRPARQGGAMLILSVGSDGEPLTAETEHSLFEPFFSTRSRGTGLGLYICKELCERHGAAIDYRQHPPAVRHRNEFFVTMPIEPDEAAPHIA